MRIIVLTMIVFTWFIDASSAQGPGTYDLKGAGIASCGTWTQDRLLGRDSVRASIDEQWVLGFIVGQEYVISADADKNYTINTDSNGIFGWVDNFCQQNPTSQIVDAALNFIEKSNTVIPSGN